MIYKLNLDFVKKHNFILIITSIVIFTIFFGNSIFYKHKLIAFTISCLVKELLMFIIPILIFPIIVKSITDISSGITSIVLVMTIIFFVFVSNFFSIMIAYFVSLEFLPNIEAIEKFKYHKTSETILSLSKFTLPTLNIAKTTIFGIVTGLILSYIPYQFLLKALERYYQISRILLNKVFIVLIPLYVLGSLLKAINEIDFISFLFVFGKSILLVFLVQSTYVFILFFIGSGLQLNKCMKSIQNTLPALFIGFSTMSSLIALPITLKATENNIKNCAIARLSISSTVNCHDIGDCIALPFLALTIIYYITGTFPDAQAYLLFAFLAALTQFSAASVPGGSIIVLLPILIQYLGFTDEMEFLIIALSICVEPIGTVINIAGNSAFAIIASRLSMKIRN